MCFSAPASFIAAGVAGAAGAASLARVAEPREYPLAAMPLFFAVQQTLEGLLWLNLPASPSGPVSTSLTQSFLLFALVFWPAFVPMAVAGAEPDAIRRKWIGACGVAGLAAAAYFLVSLSETPRNAVIEGGHIVYSGDPHLPPAMLVLYPMAACLAPMLSSLWTLRLLGVFVTLGAIAAYLAYWQAFSSVWCFFAAAASGVIVLQFEQQKRRRAIAIRQASP